MIRRAMVPGSFDPLTLGHYDLILRAAALFDEVVVAISPNGAKATLFDTETRVELACAAFADMPNIKVCTHSGLLADFCLESGCCALVKGIRSATDFDYEYQLSLINRSLRSEVETLFLPTRAEYQHFSSTFLREMLKYGQPLEKYVPAGMVAPLREAYAKVRGN